MADNGEEPNGIKRRRIVNRPRPIVSCLSCRSRKLKCDREQPCQQCMRAGRASTCSYASGSGSGTPPDSSRLSADNRSSPRNETTHLDKPPLSSTKAQWRPSPISNLLVNSDRADDNSIQSSQRPVRPPPPDACSRFAPPAERLKINGNQTRYTQADLKRALLQMFPEAQKYGGSVVSDPTIARQMSDFFKLFKDLQRLGSRWLDDVEVPSSHDLNTVLRLLPSKPVCDRLVSNYFLLWEQSFRILHQPTFAKAYDAFWTALANGNGQDHAWMAYQIAAIVAVVSSPTTTSSIKADSSQEVPRRLCAKICLFLTAWTERLSGKARTDFATLQTQALLVLGKILIQIRWDEVWNATGNLVRCAMSMGLHRDPSHFPALGPFETELRRRLWSTIIEFEMLACTAAGMPCMTRPTDYDTESPLDVDDLDLVPGMERGAQTPGSLPRIELPCQSLLARTQRLRLEFFLTQPDHRSLDELDPFIEECRYLEAQMDWLGRCERSDRTASRIWNLALIACYMRRTILTYTRAIAFYGCGHPESTVVRARSLGLDSSLALLNYASVVDSLDIAMRAPFNILTKTGASSVILQLCSEIKEDNIEQLQRPPALLIGANERPARSRKHELRQAVRIYHDRMLKRPLEIGLDARDMLSLAIVMSAVETDESSKEPAMRRGILEVMTVCREQMLRKKAARGVAAHTAANNKGAPMGSAHTQPMSHYSRPIPAATVMNDPLDAYLGSGSEMPVDLDDILNFDFSFLDSFTLGASPEFITT